MGYKYPLYKVYINSKEDLFIVCFDSEDSGTVTEVYGPNPSHKVGDNSNSWIIHTDENSWADYKDINQHLNGRNLIKAPNGT